MPHRIPCPSELIAAQVIAAETDAAARRLFTTPQQRFLRLIRGEPVELLPPVDSMEPLWSEIEKAAVERTDWARQLSDRMQPCRPAWRDLFGIRVLMGGS